MAVTIEINESTNLLTLSKNAEYDVETHVTYNDNGDADKKEVFFTIRGDVVESSPGSIWTRLLDLYNQGYDNAKLGPQRLKIKEDSTTRFDFKPEECLNSPVITSFRAKSARGAGVSRWPYEIDIYVKLFGRHDGGGSEKKYEFTSSLAIRSVDDRIIRKTWRVSCKAKTTADAYAAVRKYKPSGKGIVGEVEKFWQETRATGVWVWEVNRIQRIEETVYSLGGGDIYEADTLVGKTANERPQPILFLIPKTERMIFVEGAVRGQDPAVLKPPSPHFKEGEDFRRQSGLERRYFASVEQSEQGIWKLPYEEIWLCTSEGALNPDHSDHKTIRDYTAPADGAIAI